MGVRDRFNVGDLPPHISEGGEALIFVDQKRFPGKALKLFLDPDEDDFSGDEKKAAAARQKLSEIQRKLVEFPKSLPERVMVPIELARDPDAPPGKQIAGYYMRHVEGATELQRFSEK